MGQRVALRFAYDGSRFAGFARQPDASNTVEERLMAALVEAGVAPDVGALDWRSGSRTDRGVSALGNVVSFVSAFPAENLVRALGARVPGLWPNAAVEVGEAFEPRYAEQRTYLYFLVGAHDAAWRSRFEDALGTFQGRHDLAAFAKREEGRDTMRTIRTVSVGEGPAGPVVSVRGPSFLWQQVRRMVGAAWDVADGHRDHDELVARLAGDGGPWNGTIMPPEGLVLWDVRYRDVSFTGERMGRRLAAAWSRARAGAAARDALLGAIGPS